MSAFKNVSIKPSLAIIPTARPIQDEETEETDSEDVLREDTEEVAVPEEFQGVKTDVSIEVRQVDNSNFPEVTLYAMWLFVK